MSSPTTAPTKQITPWAIDKGIVDPITSFSERLGVSYPVGEEADEVIFTLFNEGCEIEPSDFSSAALDLVPSAFEAGVAGYEIDFITSNFANDSAGFVTNDGSTGEVKFCIRATSYEDTISVAFRDTEFMLSYDLSDLTYEVIDTIVIDPEDPDTVIETQISDIFFIAACQCEEYACSTSDVEQNSPLVICLRAETDEDVIAENVVISNFKTRITAGEGENAIEYMPVSLGTNTYMPNDLTVVTVDTDETVMISTVLIAVFYSSGFPAVKIDGFVFLEFASASGARAFEEYGIEIDLVGGNQLGCMAALVDRIKGFF